ncbi:MAG: hypothetical protein ACXWZ2_07255 [Mycobacterium sp.]
MTTHDERMTAPTQTTQPEFSGAEAEPFLTQDVSSAVPNDAASDNAPIETQPTRTETPIGDDESSMTNDVPTRAETVPQSPDVQPSDDELLFAADTSGLRSRWDDIQAVFVDDPADCVQKADTLVAEVVDQLTAAFSEARSRLEAQWARGEQASTEDLRLALQRYREFFQRLLAV